MHPVVGSVFVLHENLCPIDAAKGIVRPYRHRDRRFDVSTIAVYHQLIRRICVLLPSRHVKLLSVLRHISAIDARSMHNFIPQNGVVAQINAGDMTLTVLIVERVEPACRYSDGRPSYVGTAPRKYPNGLDQAVRAIDVMDSDCPIIVHRIKKLTIYCCLGRCSVKTYQRNCKEEEPVQPHCAKMVLSIYGTNVSLWLLR